jgi:hypothetical protein
MVLPIISAAFAVAASANLLTMFFIMVFLLSGGRSPPFYSHGYCHDTIKKTKVEAGSNQATSLILNCRGLWSKNDHRNPSG